ncbi:MAG: hypothetical protein ACXAAH_14905, partial [Promethearchaeota archaeon]
LQLDFFSINLNKLDNQDSFVHNLLNIINNFKKKGYLIINFLCDNDEEIKFSLYFTEVTFKGDESLSTENNINSFFNYNVIKRRGLKIKEFHNYLWRKGISDNFFLLKYYSQLFQNDSPDDTRDLLVFNENFKRTLLKNNVKFIRFSNYLLFIEQAFLFLTMSKLRSRFIQQIIQKYRSKYFIYILVLNKDDSMKLSEIRSFKSLKNVQILHLEEMSKFDFHIFKR